MTEQLKAPELTEDFIDTLISLRSMVRRLVRSSLGEGALSASEAELLMLVRINPESTVQNLALLLGSAPNTLSTLVGSLASDGWLQRAENPEDRRSVLVSLTEKGRSMTEEIRVRRVNFLAESFARLDQHQREAIEAALPAIQALIGELDWLQLVEAPARSRQYGIGSKR